MKSKGNNTLQRGTPMLIFNFGDCYPLFRWKPLWFSETIQLSDTFCQNYSVPTVQREGRPPTGYPKPFRGQCLAEPSANVSV